MDGVRRLLRAPDCGCGCGWREYPVRSLILLNSTHVAAAGPAGTVTLGVDVPITPSAACTREEPGGGGPVYLLLHVSGGGRADRHRGDEIYVLELTV